MEPMSREEQKNIVKEAIKEWLDDKYAQFGKWTLHGILASGLGFAVYFLVAHGWMK